MKRRTTIVLTIVLSLLLIATLPASASTFTVNSSSYARESAQLHQITNLADILNTLPEGFHDAADGTRDQFSCLAEGWATDPDDRTIDLTVRILSDGGEVAQTVAGVFRQDLDDAGVCPGGTCSFSINLAGLISPDVDHSIAVQAQDAQTGEWVDLSNTPKTLNCVEASWQQVNVNGFGNPETNGVISLEVFKDRLYAGTANGSIGGGVWRWQQDSQWQQVSEAGFGNGPANPAIVDLAVFRGKLYAGMGWDDAPGQVWRSSNGTNWQSVITDGFGDDGNIAITNFAVFKGSLYAGTGTIEGSAQIWRSTIGSDNTWTKVAPDGPGLIGNVTGFVVYQDVLYAASSHLLAQVQHKFGAASMAAIGQLSLLMDLAIQAIPQRVVLPSSAVICI